MRVLGIETTCDETAAAVVRLRPDGTGEILADEVMSQIAAHAAFGGVVPEIAARAHVEIVDMLIARALAKAGLAAKDLDGVAAAAGPGLIGGVLVGLMAGKGMALATGKPFIAVNHLEAHALTARLTADVAFPYLILLASGGHTQILAVKGVGEYDRLGATMDDAIGEAFDKTAKLLGLPYPGGPAVEAAARTRRSGAFRAAAADDRAGRTPTSRFPASRRRCGWPPSRRRRCGRATSPTSARRFRRRSSTWSRTGCGSGLKLFRERLGVAPRAVVVAGGVAANLALRSALMRFCAEAGLPMVAPPQRLCTDNGAMIAWAGVERLRLGRTDALDVAARPRWPLDPKARAGAQQQGVSDGSLAVGLRGRMLVLSRGPLACLLLLVGHVMADDAAADRAEDARDGRRNGRRRRRRARP